MENKMAPFVNEPRVPEDDEVGKQDGGVSNLA
jgi:hypothetical protein